MTILDEFRDEARRRGALGAGAALDVRTAFRIVRDMPWGFASADGADLRPETTIEAWRGTGREKHLLLGAILAALGYEVGLLAVTHEFSPESTPWLPPHLLQETRGAPIPDVHVLLRVQTNQVTDEWATIDASWPLSTRDLGLPVNEQLVTGVDQRIACDPIEMFHLASNHDHGEDNPGDDGPGPGADPGEDEDDDEDETPT
ncbi:MAG: hypothetical protein WC273_12160, partial [Dehalococcoidia bacterium]